MWILKRYETIYNGLNKHKIVCREAVFEEVIFPTDDFGNSVFTLK